jgi:hypothetical protein
MLSLTKVYQDLITLVGQILWTKEGVPKFYCWTRGIPGL